MGQPPPTSSLERELRVHRTLGALRARLSGSRDADQALRAALRASAELFGARAACLSVRDSGETQARVAFGIGEPQAWDLELLSAFLRRERPLIPRHVLLAPIERRQRLWGVIVLLRDRSRELDPYEPRAALATGALVSELVQGIDRERMLEVRSTIDRKIIEQIRPKDLFYQILHGLRTLTGYDHSAALLIGREDASEIEIVAEQIAWTKGKSRRVGLRLAVPPQLADLLRAGALAGFDRDGARWLPWGGGDGGGGELAELLDYNRADEAEAREVALLCAPLAVHGGFHGVLKIASRHRGGLGAYEAELVRRFLPHVAVALQNAHRAERLEARVLEADRKLAVANFARGVAHDVNNALGAVLPLVQQMRADGAAGTLEPQLLATDLESIERSLETCRRIFGGMLAFARTAVRSAGAESVRRAVDNALAILRDGLERRGIVCELRWPAELPAVRGRQADLEQVFFNLLANARDAMPAGGTLTVSARALDARVEVVVEDSGTGIPEADLPRILEPFYTTKPDGTGLGLSICRSIVWDMGGEMRIRSRVGEGTRVTLLLPAAGREERA